MRPAQLTLFNKEQTEKRQWSCKQKRPSSQQLPGILKKNPLGINFLSKFRLLPEPDLLLTIVILLESAISDNTKEIRTIGSDSPDNILMDVFTIQSEAYNRDHFA